MISIVMTSWNRPILLHKTLESIKQQVYGLYPVQRLEVEVIVVDSGSDTETENICKSYGAKYIKFEQVGYKGPARAINTGLRVASGEVIILQNAECQHIDPNTIEKLSSLCTDTNAVFARVFALNPEGYKQMVYCGTERPAAFFFCGAMKASLWKQHQFDEDFIEPSYDDDEFSDRLKQSGISFVFSPIEVHHQYHPRIAHDESISRALYMSKKAFGRAK